MSTTENQLLDPPSTYGEWLNAFDYLKSKSSVDDKVIQRISKGSLRGNDKVHASFQVQLIETINKMIDLRVRKFRNDINRCIELNELSDIPALFLNLKNEIRKCFFFSQLDFVVEDIRNELQQSIEKQISVFWEETTKFLHEQAMEYSNSELEDALFHIGRMRLFVS